MNESTKPSMGNDLILRDHLAIYRTVMANERTLLAYTRTALAMIVVGVSVVEFADWGAGSIVGWAMTLGGAVLQAIGVQRFRTTRERIRKSG